MTQQAKRIATRIRAGWTTARATGWVCAVALFLMTASAAPAAEEAGPKGTGDAGLAERFAEVGQNTLRVKEIKDPVWQQSAAMMEAAMRLAPAEVRFARLRVEAELGAQNLDAAAEALRTVLKLEPTDQGAQVQLIELFSRRMENAGARIKYLQGVADEQSVAAEVRSHAAMSLAQLLNDRFQQKEALAAVENALKLNPYNPEAVRLKYAMIGENLKGTELASLFIAMLRSNPCQPDVCARLARELADLGVPAEAGAWYDRAIGLQQLSGQPVDPYLMVDFAANLFVRGQGEQAGNYLTQLLNAQPYNADAWFVKLAIERQGPKKEQFDDSRRMARIALLNRLAEARQKNGIKQATTRPMTSKDPWEFPDMAAEVAAFDAQTPVETRSAYISCLADLAWLEVFYNQNAVDARKAIAPLTTLAGVEKPTVARLDGWACLLENKVDEARQKLSAVSEVDPLAALGLLRMDRSDPAKKDKLVMAAEKLWTDSPRGVLSAIVWSDVRDLEPKQIAHAGSEAYLAEVHKLPAGWMNIAISPQAFYTVTCETKNNTRAYGWPIITKVTLQNLSDMDIPISPAGALRPDLWIDVRFIGNAVQLFAELPNQTLSGVAYERMNGQLVLKARSSVTRDMRVDQGPLAILLAQRPAASITMSIVTQTNPLAVSGGIIPGPAGQRMQSPRAFERGGTPLGTQLQRQRIYQTMAMADADERLRCIDLLEAFAVMIGREPASSPNKPVMGEVTGALQGAISDPAASVQAWSRRSMALLSADQDAERLIGKMAESEAWQQRLCAVVAAQARKAELAMAVAKRLAADADPTVKRYALATEAAIHMAATRPASGPATGPTTAPAARPATTP